MKSGTRHLEGQAWWGGADDATSTIYHAEAVEQNEVFIEAEGIASYLSDEERDAQSLKLNVSALDALAFAKQIEAAAYEAMAEQEANEPS